MKQAMIVAPQPEAVDAGADVLRAGGNAVDAAIACALVETVVDLLMCGIAGFGSAQVYMPGRGVHETIDFHGRVPAAATPDMWVDLIEAETRDGFGFILKGHVNDVGHQSVTVPGSLKAYHEALGRFGTMAWADIVAPAIAYAEGGFPRHPRHPSLLDLGGSLGPGPDHRPPAPHGGGAEAVLRARREFAPARQRDAQPGLCRHASPDRGGGAGHFLSGLSPKDT